METTEPTKPARRGTEKRKKSFLVTSRYDEAEFAELDEAASRAGLTRASFQRVQSLAKPKTRSTRRAPVERELLAKTLGQLGRIGGLLNQLAKIGNTRGGLDTDEQRVLAGTLHHLRAAMPPLMEALGRKK